jgi:hypothetical protein
VRQARPAGHGAAGCPALTEALARHGVPGQILTDNGKVFTGFNGRKLRDEPQITRAVTEGVACQGHGAIVGVARHFSAVSGIMTMM